MANKKITDLMSGTPTRDSLFESAIDISGTMDSRKVTTGAIADLASTNVAAPYNSATTYAIGQYCLYEGNIYRCIAITTGTFDATKWTQIVVTSEFRRVVELTTAQYEALSSAEQNNGTLYILTDGIPPSETVTGSDIIPFIDVSDSNKPKSTTAEAVAGLFLGGVKISTATLDNATTINSPLYTSQCIAFVARDRSGIYIGSNKDVLTAVSANGITTSKGTSGGQHIISLTNNGGTTSVVIFIYI